MSKFIKALKKSQAVNHQPSPKPTPTKVINISPKTVDALKLATSPTQGQAEESPLLQDRLDPRLASFLEPGSLAVESFKMLLAKILTRKSRSRPRTIMVTSPQPMDGKTMVATNLAISISQGINEYVLLVDCDLRRPSIDRILGLNAHEGISEYLEKGVSLGPYLVKTPISKLTVLPAGKPSPNPSEPLTTFLASMVDGVLLVVRSGKTPRDSVLDAIEIIDLNKIIGVVFNACNKSPKDYNDYYKYYRKDRS